MKRSTNESGCTVENEELGLAAVFADEIVKSTIVWDEQCMILVLMMRWRAASEWRWQLVKMKSRMSAEGRSLTNVEKQIEASGQR